MIIKKNAETPALIRVALTDDHPMVVSGIQNMLRPYQNICVTGAYGSASALLNALPNCCPDVLLLDIQLPDQSGEEIVPVIRALYPQLAILALTSLDTPFHVRSMLEKGCLGYLLKRTDNETLVEAIETVRSGAQYIEPTLKEELLLTLTQPKRQIQLTRREKEILQLIAAEMTTQQIAQALFLSHKTVENHRISLMQKFGTKNVVGLVKAALKMGLVH